MLRDGFARGFEQSIPLAYRDSTTDHDHARVEHVDDADESRSEGAPRVLHDLVGRLVLGVFEGRDLRRADIAQPLVSRRARDPRAAADRLKVAARAAAAFGTLQIDRQMSE